MRKYRIVKKTCLDDSVNFDVDYMFGDTWVNITNRSDLSEAHHTLRFLKYKEVISEEVVYSD